MVVTISPNFNLYKIVVSNFNHFNFYDTALLAIWSAFYKKLKRAFDLIVLCDLF